MVHFRVTQCHKYLLLIFIIQCVCASLRLPSISVLNGSVVTDSEREDAERFFIRYYLDYPEEELPYRYSALTVSFLTIVSVCVMYVCVCVLSRLTA